MSEGEQCKGSPTAVSRPAVPGEPARADRDSRIRMPSAATTASDFASASIVAYYTDVNTEGEIRQIMDSLSQPNS